MKKLLLLAIILASFSCAKQETVTLKEAVESECFDTLRVNVIILGTDTLIGTIEIEKVIK